MSIPVTLERAEAHEAMALGRTYLADAKAAIDARNTSEAREKSLAAAALFYFAASYNEQHPTRDTSSGNSTGLGEDTKP